MNFAHIATQISDFLFAVLRITGSAVTGPHGAVTLDSKGSVGGFGTSGDPDDNGERSVGKEAFGAPGIVYRPRPPESVGAETIGAEALAYRTFAGAQPYSYRDLRWNRSYPDPKEGDLAWVGYSGGFLSWEDVKTGSNMSQRGTFYIPYYDGSTLKAHVIQADPSGALQIIQGDGYALSMDPNNGIVLRSATGQSWMKLLDNNFEVVAETITMRGNVALGANTSAAVPLNPGSATQPTPSVFFSPT
jgi:hypothetical protein